MNNKKLNTMNRIIKFRGLDDSGEWIYGFYFESDGFSKIWTKEPNPFQPEIFSVIVKAETVGQYTGLNDKNGKEIYEGDVIKASITYSGELIEQNATVVFKKGQFTTGSNEVNSWVSKKALVIGNIFQNPELLKQ